MSRTFSTFLEAETFLGPDFTRVGTDTAAEEFDYIDWDRNCARISRHIDGWIVEFKDEMVEVEA